ncbi:putative cell wall binding repeat protein, partial [Bacillus sp. 196mf]
DGKQYYFDQDGSMHKWTLHDNGKQYYFNEDGSMHTGWLKWNSDKKWSYFDKDGFLVNGWKEIDGQKYYFDENATMITGWLQDEKNLYCFNSNGALITQNSPGTPHEYYPISPTGELNFNPFNWNKIKAYIDNTGHVVKIDDEYISDGIETIIKKYGLTVNKN